MAVLLRPSDFFNRELCALVGLLTFAIAVVLLLHRICYYAARSLTHRRPPPPQPRGFEVIAPPDRTRAGQDDPST